MDANRSGVSNSNYCYVCDAMRTAVSENRYLRRVQETEEQEHCAARKRMGLEGPE
jgi:hypothetical protein